MSTIAEKADDEKIAQSLREQAAFDDHACPEFDLKRGNGRSQQVSRPIEEIADATWDFLYLIIEIRSFFFPSHDLLYHGRHSGALLP